MKGEDMAYTPMTAEQYVVAELQDAKDRIRMLKDNNAFLTEQLNEANDLLNQICEKLEIHHSEYSGNYISWDLMPTERNDPKLFAELKRRIENKGAV